MSNPAFSKLLKNKTFRLTLISILLALAAAMLLKAYVNEKIFAGTGGRIVSVVQAAADLPAGSIIKAEDLTIATIPESYAQPRSVSARNRSFLIGQKPSVSLTKGEGIQWNEIQLSPDETLEGRLGADERAVSIRVDETGAVTGMIQPGNRVDVVCQMRTGKAGITMHMVAQNMTILAVDKRTSANLEAEGKKSGSDDGSVSSVTFRADADQAMLLSYAESQGRIVLLLRNNMNIISRPHPDVGSAALAASNNPGEANNPPGATASPGASGDYPTIYSPGKAPRVGNLPGDSDLINELKKLKPEDAKQRILQELQKSSENQPQ